MVAAALTPARPTVRPDLRPVRDVLRSLAGRGDFRAGVLVGILSIALFYYWLLTQVSDFGRLAEAISTEPIYRVGMGVLVPLSFTLFGLNVGVLVVLWRARLRLRAQAGTAFGATAGAFAAGCPLCGAYLLTLLGVTSGLAAMPFGGLELWILAVSVMGFSLYRSLRALQRCAGVQAEGSCAGLSVVRRRDVRLLSLLAGLMAAGLVAMLLVNEPLLQ